MAMKSNALKSRGSFENSFTLIELLTCVAVIAILIALLMPVLGRAKQKARDVTCLANQRQCAMALIGFAGDNAGYMPQSKTTQVYSSTFYYSRSYGGKRDLVNELGPYIGSFDVWRCPFLEGAAPIDSPDNTRSTQLRGSYCYWGNLSGISGTVLQLQVQKQDPLNVLMSDLAYEWRSNGWRVNHDEGMGELRGPVWTDMPSFWAYFSGFPRGVMQIYADGHGEWCEGDKLKEVYRPWNDTKMYAAGNTAVK